MFSSWHLLDKNGDVKNLMARINNVAERNNKRMSALFPTAHLDLIHFIETTNEDIGDQMKRVEHIKAGNKSRDEFEDVHITDPPKGYETFDRKALNILWFGNNNIRIQVTISIDSDGDTPHFEHSNSNTLFITYVAKGSVSDVAGLEAGNKPVKDGQEISQDEFKRMLAQTPCTFNTIRTVKLETKKKRNTDKKRKRKDEEKDKKGEEETEKEEEED